MSQQVCFSSWVAIVPDKMIGRWVKKKYIPNAEILNFGEFGDPRDNVPMELLDTETYDAMRTEVIEWYDGILDYVEKWLIRNNLLKISKGDIRTQMCVETDPKSEAVKNWNAPLAKKGNKVAQVKEKFGLVTIYFRKTTQEEWDKIKKFAQKVEEKFDCEVSVS